MARLEFEGFGGLTIVGTSFGSPEDPPVLLLPSLGHVREFWFGSAQALADAGRYAICVDLRGHGDSAPRRNGRYDFEAYVADLRAILSSLSGRAVVVASGMSALVALAATGEGGPHLVSGLALADVSIWFEPKLVERMGEALLRRASQFATPDMILDVIAAAYPSEPRPAGTDRLLAAYARRADGSFEWRGDPRALQAANIPAAQARLVEAVGQIATPVTLIRGALNESVSGEAIRKLRDMISGAELAEIEGAGHYVAADREDEFNAILLDFLERKAPRQPVTYIGGSEPRVLRDALGCFATGVTIVTTFDADGEPIGLTANSFTSVSLDPPLILFSLANTSANMATFREAGRFAVNVLHIGQQPLASRFAQRGVARFEGVDWATRAGGGSPILAGSLASFDCRTHAIHDGGDHLIFIGEVKHAWFEPHRDPLLYFRGRFRRLHFA